MSCSLSQAMSTRSVDGTTVCSALLHFMRGAGHALGLLDLELPGPALEGGGRPGHCGCVCGS